MADVEAPSSAAELEMTGSTSTENATADADVDFVEDGDVSGMDMAALLERIRARYKLVCSVLGVRPRLRVAGQAPSDESGAVPGAEGEQQDNKQKAFIGGRLVDTTRLKY